MEKLNKMKKHSIENIYINIILSILLFVFVSPWFFASIAMFIGQYIELNNFVKKIEKENK